MWFDIQVTHQQLMLDVCFVCVCVYGIVCAWNRCKRLHHWNILFLHQSFFFLKCVCVCAELPHIHLQHNRIKAKVFLNQYRIKYPQVFFRRSHFCNHCNEIWLVCVLVVCALSEQTIETTFCCKVNCLSCCCRFYFFLHLFVCRGSVRRFPYVPVYCADIYLYCNGNANA